jgi:hypothetical protein
LVGGTPFKQQDEHKPVVVRRFRDKSLKLGQGKNQKTPAKAKITNRRLGLFVMTDMESPLLAKYWTPSGPPTCRFQHILGKGRSSGGIDRVVEVGGIYKSHLGERSSDLKRLPMASRRQCQTSALAFEDGVAALFFDSLLLACRRGVTTEIALALASCQRRSSAFLIVSGPADGISAGIIFAGGTLSSVSTFSVFTRVPDSSSLSDFANSFGADAGSLLL